MEMVKAVTVFAPAKINLSLDITGRLNNGYHTLKMLMQTVSLYDVITMIKTSKNGIQVTSNVNIVKKKEDNIAVKVANEFFKQTNILGNIKINIEKNIPMQAGMGGGSVDGAGVLVGLNRLYNTNLSVKQLCDIGKGISSDIPFCIVGKTAIVEGFGDIIYPINDLKDCFFVIVKPDFSVDTKMAYRTFDHYNKKFTFDSTIIINAINDNNIDLMATSMFNTFEHICEVDRIKIVKEEFMENNALGSLLTGSGSAVFGVFKDEDIAQKCFDNLKQKYKECYLVTPCEGIYIK